MEENGTSNGSAGELPDDIQRWAAKRRAAQEAFNTEHGIARDDREKTREPAAGISTWTITMRRPAAGGEVDYRRGLAGESHHGARADEGGGPAPEFGPQLRTGSRNCAQQIYKT
jgi:hypothetical protein